MRSIWDRLALILCVAVILAAALVGWLVFENLPHLEDEFAYLWQARVLAGGNLSLPTPEFSKSFLVPFVVDYHGQRFAKYPPGWPAILSLGVRVGWPAVINPLLAGLAIWLTYQLGKRSLGEQTAFLGALLLGTSPVFLILAGSLLSHLWSLVLALIFILFWVAGLEDRKEKARLNPSLIAGASLGLLGLTRPLTALALAVPFFLEGLVILYRGPGWKRRQVVIAGGITLLLLSLYPVWQRAVTGSFTTNPYTLWWPYDKFGFGKGFGVTESGHSLSQGWRNTRYSLRVAASDMFGWPKISWIFLPFGLWAARKSRLSYYSTGITISLILLYLGYWVSSWLYGPRYYFEALPGLVLLSAAGISWLAGWIKLPDGNEAGAGPLTRGRAPLIVLVLGLLLFVNFYYYLPSRLGGLKGLYGIEKADLLPFESQVVEEYQPALVIVDSKHWMPYGSLLVLESPQLDSPLIFAWSINPHTDRKLADFYQDQRNILYYYPDRDRNTLYTYPLPGSLIE